MKDAPSMINLVLKAVALGMAVAVVVLGMMDSVPITAQVNMLGLGLFALAVTGLRK